MAEPARKRRKAAPPAATPPADDGGLGGLYDFLPPPDPEKDEKAKAEAKKKELPPLPPEDKSRVVFLDIDGVLLPAGSVETITIDGVQLPVRETSWPRRSSARPRSGRTCAPLCSRPERASSSPPSGGAPSR
ncbi:unnamed protein product [Prorocentrum cordatum]|uniref:Uncharacterized protein n=1 Tax=Prorocentrum cordatum TaxID=2364126 RepID=A0ABN9TU44_9DINO|nr:unnamed protein product [Polarella glacialis]